MFDISYDSTEEPSPPRISAGHSTSWWIALLSIPLLFSLFTFFTYEVRLHPAHKVVSIREGVSAREVATLIEEEGVAFSDMSVLLSLYLQFGAGDIKAGDYFFDEPQSSWRIAHRLIQGDYHLTPIRIVIPEGATVEDMATLLDQDLDGLFDPRSFRELAREKEGYLFPDTYFFLPNTTAERVITVLEDTFSHKIGELKEELDAFGQPLHDVVVMASLLEKEARELETRRMIAGILWRRLLIGMPLQVDAVFPYIIGKNTFELSLEDLAYDSPYNTYRNKGLPPGAIGSPSFEALLAAVTPIESDYLYYLADLEGVTHYAETFDEHVANKRRYLQ